ncbi:MAG: trehalase family glycosidase [Henriciella sp.]
MSTQLDQIAEQILRDNDRGGYTVPTPGLYPYQWNWDSAFAALGFAAFDMSRAWREIETLFDGQWPDGMVPHIIFRATQPGYFPGPDAWQTNKDPLSSGITQPPVAASIVRILYEQDQDKARLEALYPKLLASHRWFAEFRDPLNNGLVMTTHPWETGRDNCPEWDAPARNVDISNVSPYQRSDVSHVDSDMRPQNVDYDRYMAMLEFGRSAKWDHAEIASNGPFRVLDVGMTMILIRANRDLAWLAEQLGRDEDADYLREQIEKAESGASYLWDDTARAFCSKDLKTDLSSSLCTNASFLAFYANVGTTEQRSALLKNFERVASAATFTAPSTDPEHPEFDSKRYWRGPIWVVVNFMIAEGLREQGCEHQAARVQHDTKKVIERSGFFESFDPVTGKGSGGSDFTWTAAIWLHWARFAHSSTQFLEGQGA